MSKLPSKKGGDRERNKRSPSCSEIGFGSKGFYNTVAPMKTGGLRKTNREKTLTLSKENFPVEEC
jgi:hypothetical protein